LESLEGLNSLEVIDDHFFLVGCVLLENLTGLNGLKHIQGRFYINDNFNLRSLEGLDSLTSIARNLYITSNEHLESVDGLESLTNINGDLIIGSDHEYYDDGKGNPVLASLSAFSSELQVKGRVRVGFNALLPDCELCALAGKINYGEAFQYIDGMGLNLVDGCTAGCSEDTYGCYQGDYTIESQDDIDALSSYTCVNGDVQISISTVIAFSGLENLRSVGGDLRIVDNTNLIKLGSLQNLERVRGGLYISNHKYLENIDEFASLQGSIGSLYVSNNDALQSLSGLENVNYICNTVQVKGNELLTTLDGMHHIEEIGHLFWIINTGLESLSGLEGLRVVGDGGFDIVSNANLTTVSGLGGLEKAEGKITIIDNPLLENMEGFSSLISVNSLGIGANSGLKTLDGLETLTIINEYLEVGAEDWNGTGDFSNPALKSIYGLRNVTRVGQKVRIWGNTSLPQCQVDEFAATTGIYNIVTISPNGDTDTAYCDGLDF
ncbi:MAG: hypothetical protein JXX14_13410, partial [Deltaproteobacteria bacterium]|nr:hypothetical protein [Deltaproteobacteria bacterium]